MSSATVTHGYDVSSFFCNYYCSKWYEKHWICNWLVKENKFGAATFWVRYLFPSVYLFSGTFFRDLVERIVLPVLSLLPFLTFVNCEGPYLAEGFLHNICPCFDIVFAPLGLITRTSNKIVEIVVISGYYLIINPFKKIRNQRTSCSEYTFPYQKLTERCQWKRKIFHRN